MTDWTNGISVIVPTYKRPAGVALALKSLCQQSVGNRPIEIIVADNDPAGSARIFVESFEGCPHPVIYKHVPQPGVSNARNGALSVARGRFIAFLDDDMEALEDWLARLVETSLKYQSAITFGPAIANMPNKDDPLSEYMIPFFSRTTDAPEGYIHECFGTGGCLLDLSLCHMPVPPFNPLYNETGGEDDALFFHLIKHGAKVAWAKTAKSWEHVPARRATPEYLWTRNFAFGQGPTQTAADKGVSGIFGIVKWMAVGAVQLGLYGPPYLLLKALKKPGYIPYQARTAQALGKMFWWSGFKPKLYGDNATTEQSVL